MARHDLAWLGIRLAMAWQGVAWHGKAGLDRTWHGKARLDMSWARHGKVSLCKARLG